MEPKVRRSIIYLMFPNSERDRKRKWVRKIFQEEMVALAMWLS